MWIGGKRLSTAPSLAGRPAKDLVFRVARDRLGVIAQDANLATLDRSRPTGQGRPEYGRMASYGHGRMAYGFG